MTIYPAENTPIFDPLAQEVGLVCAAVYGVVWRYCQKYDGVCRASLETLGREIKVDRATMMRNIKTLCDSGYLIDQTPGLRNVPHTYVLGKSVAECNSYKEAQADTEEDKSVVMRNSLLPETVTEDNKSVAHNNTTIESVAENNSSNPTVAESNLKKEESLIKESNPIKESKRGSVKNHPRPPEIPSFRIYVEITEYHAINKHWRGEMARIVGDKPDDLDFWRKVVIGWTGKYSTKHNVEGMLDYYKRREIPGYDPNRNGATNGQHSKHPTGRNTDPDRIPSWDPYAESRTTPG